MSKIAENIDKLKNTISDDVLLVAVSKTKPSSDIQEAYIAGQRHFGENKIQEMQGKYEELPKDIKWHMIGHVQTNKVKYMASFVHLVHGVDSLKLLKEINKRAKQNQRVIDCLLQVHIAEEDTKFGFDNEEIKEILESDMLDQFENIKIRGLMGMATFTDDEKQVAREFAKLRSIYDQFNGKYQDFDILSMGMSGDYQIAIENGSNLVRIGSSIFGERNYSI
jgi:pyridoxal phosphate enzyme (YggS family)